MKVIASASRFLGVGLFGAMTIGVAAQDLGLRLVSDGCSVSLSTGANNSIAANTDVSAGYLIEAGNGRGSFARSELVVQRGNAGMTVQLTESNGYYAASSGIPFLSNRLNLILQSPRPARVRLQIACSWNYITQGFASGSGSFSGQGLSISTPFGSGSGQLARTHDVDLPAGAPISFLLADGFFLQTNGARIDWNVQIEPIADDACAPTSYGRGCSLDLAIGADFVRTGEQYAELLLRGGAVPGLLIVGVQRTAIPVGPCTLYNDALVVLQVGAGRTYFAPPQLPGWTFLLQGAALDGATLVASSGLQLDCR